MYPSASYGYVLKLVIVNMVMNNMLYNCVEHTCLEIPVGLFVNNINYGKGTL